ncbi:DUF4198 domain-containing protein [Roseovarius pelagicus]|uniref:DUF4198 domain-containing protein n=1 Tax=Roseovarius pelagicus TaxID=2980108 RepID=A0ABY6DDL6_9RHOB|nr:DUF4198 domain-containing protein [Roseovarius pelagicus]UXX83640.1 DUF4198 domain-containing protein [Roseovarius pelagicus]
MKHHLTITLACLVTLLWPARASLAHEFWIEPTQFQVENGATLTASLRNGQDFEGINLAYFDRRIVRFDWHMNGVTTPVVARAGDTPALSMTAPAPGLMILTYQSTPSKVSYSEWEKFARFAEHKRFADITSRHAERDLPDADFTEVYTRYAKSLIGIAGARGDDHATGLEIEIVALQNPYTRSETDPLPVQVLYQNVPRADAQVEIFARAPDGTVTVSTAQTDDQGIAQVPVQPGHAYLLDNVVLRAPAPDVAAEHDAVWETLWASLTFAIPN